MIIDRKQFEIAGKSLFEKLTIQSPLQYAAVFPNEACFLHFKEGQINLKSATAELKVSSSESILMKCGNYFANLIPQTSKGAMEVFAVHLYPDLLRDIYKNEIPPTFKLNTPSAYSQTIPNSSVLVHFIDSMDFYFENPGLVTPDLLILKIKELILLLLQTDQAGSVAELFAKLFTPRQAGIREVIDAHLFSNLTIPELATLAGLSLSSFKREFQKVYEDTPANYIKIKRIEEAQKLVQYSDLSISEICYRLGFGDVSNFSKAFKKQTGNTPTTYRNIS